MNKYKVTSAYPYFEEHSIEADYSDVNHDGHLIFYVTNTIVDVSRQPWGTTQGVIAIFASGSWASAKKVDTIE